MRRSTCVARTFTHETRGLSCDHDDAIAATASSSSSFFTLSQHQAWCGSVTTVLSGLSITFVRSWATCNALNTRMRREKAVYELMVLSQSSARERL